MLKRVTRGWLVRAGIASAVGAAAIMIAVTMVGGRAQAAGATIDWAVSGGGVQPVGGSPFTVNINSSNFVPDITQPTWGGYNFQLTYDPTVLNLDSVAAGGVTAGCGSNWAQIPSSPGQILTTCVFQSSTNVSPPPTDVIQFDCLKAGVSPLHMVTLGEDATQGSTFFDENAVNITTSLTDGSVNCVLPITKSDDTGGTAAAGTTVTYTIHVGNPGASSSFGHSVDDTFDSTLTGVTFTGGTAGYDAFGGSCGVAAGPPAVLSCTNLAVDTDPTGLDLTVTADIPLSDAGSTICNTATIDAVQDSNQDCFDVAPATLTVQKSADAASYKAGDAISWTITVNNTGGSPAANVAVSDTATDGFDITGQTGSANCTPTGTTATTATWDCGATLSSGDGPQVLTVTGTVHTPNPTDLSCNNDVDVTADNATTASASASTSCLSKDVQMKKEPHNGGNLDANSENANLFLSCTDPSCTALNPFVIDEWALNVSGDPQGVGAFEFDVLYDSALFDVQIDPTGWLYSTGRIPGDAGIGGCSATIITEHDIRFGCVSKNPQPLATTNWQASTSYPNPGYIFDNNGYIWSINGGVTAATPRPDFEANEVSGATLTDNLSTWTFVGEGGCLGPDNVTPLAYAICGPKDNAVIATITVTPKQVLLKQLTPGNDNGAIRTLIDQGCELADIWGHPLSAAPDPSGVDALGREIPLGGIDPGGALNAANCQSLTLTVRILEGDMNTDCVVDVSDDQAEASHYGATFGALLYEPWYDLEPALKDGDVDIKDLQKVFGRNGSTCEYPVPPQNAMSQPGDP